MCTCMGTCMCMWVCTRMRFSHFWKPKCECCHVSHSYLAHDVHVSHCRGTSSKRHWNDNLNYTQKLVDLPSLSLPALDAVDGLDVDESTMQTLQHFYMSDLGEMWWWESEWDTVCEADLLPCLSLCRFNCVTLLLLGRRLGVAGGHILGCVWPGGISRPLPYLEQYRCSITRGKKKFWFKNNKYMFTFF